MDSAERRSMVVLRAMLEARLDSVCDVIRLIDEGDGREQQYIDTLRDRIREIDGMLTNDNGGVK